MYEYLGKIDVADSMCPAPLMIMSFVNVNIMLIFTLQKGFKYYRAFMVKIISFVTNSSRLHVDVLFKCHIFV